MPHLLYGAGKVPSPGSPVFDTHRQGACADVATATIGPLPVTTVAERIGTNPPVRWADFGMDAAAFFFAPGRVSGTVPRPLPCAPTCSSA